MIEGPDGTYVLDLTTGQLYRIDTANLGEATASSNVGSGVDVVVGGGKAYVVDMKAGKVALRISAGCGGSGFGSGR